MIEALIIILLSKGVNSGFLVLIIIKVGTANKRERLPIISISVYIGQFNNLKNIPITATLFDIPENLSTNFSYLLAFLSSLIANDPK
jgi:hypothetical protein